MGDKIRTRCWRDDQRDYNPSSVQKGGLNDKRRFKGALTTLYGAEVSLRARHWPPYKCTVMAVSLKSQTERSELLNSNTLQAFILKKKTIGTNAKTFPSLTCVPLTQLCSSFRFQKRKKEKKSQKLHSFQSIVVTEPVARIPFFCVLVRNKEGFFVCFGLLFKTFMCI